MSEENTINIQPQPKQLEFLSTSADIAIYGGSAGGGKSWALLLDLFRWVKIKDYYSVLFRNTYKEIKNPGSLWDESYKLYDYYPGALPNKTNLTWEFPDENGNFISKIVMSYLDDDKDKYAWKGAQVAVIAFDELDTFKEDVFWYLVSRNRSMCGIKPYIRATCNPNPDSFVAKLIDWWIDDDGWAIPERSGVIRYLYRQGGENEFFDTVEELQEKYPDAERGIDYKSFTFIHADIYDNQELLKKDPSYLANLKNLNYVDRMRLLKGNWKVRAGGGSLFKDEWWGTSNALLRRYGATSVRYWDRAATIPHEGNPDPDWTVGVLMTKTKEGMFYIEDVVRFRDTPLNVKKKIRQTAMLDRQAGYDPIIWLEQEPGAAGVSEVQELIRYLTGFNAKSEKKIIDKVTAAAPYSAQVEAGNVILIRGEWNDVFKAEHLNFPSPDADAKDDQVDAGSGAFRKLFKHKRAGAL